MTDDRPFYPETLPDDMPLVSTAVAEILAQSFRDKLDHGFDQQYAYGTHKVYAKEAALTLKAAQTANNKGRLTRTHLILASTFAAVSQTNVDTLRPALIALASETLDWIEQIDSFDDDDFEDDDE